MIFFNRSFIMELIIICAIVTKQPISMIIFGFAQYLDVIDVYVCCNSSEKRTTFYNGKNVIVEKPHARF